jgi:hypothetical protein
MRLWLFVAALALLACSGPRARIPVSLGDTAGAEFYPYEATSASDSSFAYAQVSSPNVFEWKAVTVRFEPQAVFEGNRLQVLFDVSVENAGTRPFALEDYSAYVALPDDNGDWNYRLLFTESKVAPVPARGKAKVRYYTQLYGMAPPDKFVFVMQSFFGGRDAGFAFVRQSREGSR